MRAAMIEVLSWLGSTTPCGFSIAELPQSQLFHDAPRSRIPHPRHGNHPVQTDAFEDVPQGAPRRFRRQSAAPKRPRQPPADLRLQPFAPIANTAKTDQFPAG